MRILDCHDSAKAESRNDGKVERFYFLQKQKVAKTFILIRTSCGFCFFIWIASIFYENLAMTNLVSAEVFLMRNRGCVATSKEIRLRVY